MQLNKQARTEISSHFVQVMKECGVSKKVFANLISHFFYDDSRRDWWSVYEGWGFQPCLDNHKILWFTLTNPQGLQFNFSLVGKPHYGEDYILLGGTAYCG